MPVYAVSQRFVMMRFVQLIFSYFMYFCQADMFLCTSCLHSALFNLVACASFVIIFIPDLNNNICILSVGFMLSMWCLLVS